jgi:drug/metabolite transporter (DMT)-like permease
MGSGGFECILGALSFGLLACASKAAERRGCNSNALVFWLFAWSTILMSARTFGVKKHISITWPVIALAVVFGICAAVAYFAFQMSMQYGKLTVGWLMMNLSAGVPTVVSIWVYREHLTVLKMVAFGLAFVALLLLYRGNQLESAAHSREAR